MKRVIKGITTVILSVSILLGTTMSVLAAYEGISSTAGSTGVYCEVGFNGNSAYAYVSANDDVDAHMEGTVLFSNGKTRALYGGFDQRTYGQVSVSWDYVVLSASCDFTVVSEDGVFRHYSYAN